MQAAAAANSAASTGYTISTVAGNGSFTYSGDGGLAVSAGVDPTGVAVDGSGNLYIANYNSHQIRKVAGGIITSVVGTGVAGYSGDGGPAVNARLNHPTGIAVDSSGNLYIADYDNKRISKV